MLAPFPSRQSVGAGAVRRLRLRVPAGLAAPTLAAALTAGLVWVGLGLRPADLHAPFFYQADTLLIFPLVRSVVTDGWAGLWTIPHLGFPGVQEWYDFPVADWLHFAGLWALGRVAEPVAVYNLYFLLGYPLAAAAAAWAGRRLDLSAPAAVAAGVLYALLPFHQGRDIHQLFLSSYFVVPVTCVQAVLAARGRGLGWVAGLAAGLAAGTGGAYYAFFACVVLAAAAAHASAVHGWRAGRFGLAAAAAVVAGGVLVHLPSLAYHAEHGDNARVTTRRVLDVEGHGLRLVTLAMPHTEHRSRLLADVRWRFSAMRFDHQSENDYSGLGLAPAAGLGACLLAVLFPHRRTAGLVVAGRLCLAVVLVGTVGGLCSAIGEAGFTQVRAYARAVIYLGLFGAVAAAGLVDRVGGRWRWPAAALLVAFGVWDQTPRRWFTGRAGEVRQAHARGYREDAAFYAAVEAQHPGAVVFCLPFAPWPEDRHEHVRPSLHTRTWRYSYGAVRYREADDWQRRVAARPADEFLRRACVRGFDAVIYRRDIPLDYHHPSPSLDDLLAELGPDTPQWEHPDWNSVYLDLRPYRNKLRDAVGAAEFDRQAREEAEAVSALWLSGSDCYAWSGHEDDARWLNRRAKLMLVNPTDRSRRVTVRATVGGLAPGLVYADLSAAGPVWAGHWPGATTGTRIESTFDLPPGRHPVVLTTRPGPPFGGYRVPQGRVVDPKLLIELTDWTLVHSD